MLGLRANLNTIEFHTKCLSLKEQLTLDMSVALGGDVCIVLGST